MDAKFFDSIEGFIQKHENSFDSQQEFKLEYTQIYDEFVTEFEGKLEAFIVSKKSTVEDFYKLVKKAVDLDDPDIQAFLDLFLMCMSFETFTDVAKDPVKRQYVSSIMKRHSQMLPG